MIKEIILNFGLKNRSEILKFDPGSITVFVGPNNSGKSLLLREIETFCNSGSSTNNILNNIIFHALSDEELSQNIKSMKIPYGPNEPHPPDTIKYGRFHSIKGFLQFKSKFQDLLTYKNFPDYQENFIQNYISMYVSRFGGQERFKLIKPQTVHDLKAPPINSLSYLFKNDEKREQVRNLVHEAFSKYFVIDPTHMGQLSIRLSEVLPNSKTIEQGWTDQSIQFHKKAKPISNFSDGVQAFTGLIMTVIAGEEKIILVDEPEAFLHPSLVSLLGKKLSALMNKRAGNLIVATHSPFFIMGCLQSGKKLNIIRLTYDDAHSTARLLEPDKVAKLFKNPLLRSIGVLQSLFYSAVIVTEGDTDRAFYNEINERMLAQNDSRSIDNALFLNAQNKQTIWDIVSPLRSMGIPAVGIVDIDFIKEGGQNFTKALKASGVPDTMHSSLSDMRSNLHKYFKETKEDMKKNGGIFLLQETEKEMAEQFFKTLKEYGIFVVSGGELESWLKDLTCTGHKSSWLVQVFDKMGSDPDDSNYITPQEGDVWDFLKLISTWVNNPNRKGMKNL